MPLTYEQLRTAVTGDTAGARSTISLEPLGGPDDKVFPPTYGVGERELRYAVEKRVVTDGDGVKATVESVVLDSVASQANRLELALLESIRHGELAAPVTAVNFAAHGLYGIDRISDYEAPHRIFDALLRDSFDGDALFRDGEVGRAITDAVPRNATALLRNSPHTLVFGGWDSTGPKGGRGAKYERALTSEIVAHGIQTGVKTSSRIDPVGIELKVGSIYEATRAGTEVDWTTDPDAAVKDGKGKPRLYTRGSKADAGKPSNLNHGNVKPSIDQWAGGITATQIVGTMVLSFIQLRRLRFPTDVHGKAFDPEQRREAEATARTALAALGIAATVLAYEQGFDLRSRCVLIPAEELTLELVGRAHNIDTVALDTEAALALVAEAAAQADKHGVGWRTEEMELRPSDRLVDLIRRSQDQTVPGDENS